MHFLRVSSNLATFRPLNDNEAPNFAKYSAVVAPIPELAPENKKICYMLIRKMVQNTCDKGYFSFKIRHFARFLCTNKQMQYFQQIISDFSRFLCKKDEDKNEVIFQKFWIPLELQC